MLDSGIQIRTERYDGPLGLLLLLIQREEMDIRDLDISLITGQYLSYLQKWHDLNFDHAGEYLLMAATLLFLKSELCLHEKEKLSQIINDEENTLGITSKADLVRRLEELQRFQRLGEKLWKLPRRDHDIFVRPKLDRQTLANTLLQPMELNTLVMAMMDILIRDKRKFTIMERDRLSIKEKLLELKNVLLEGVSITLADIFQMHERSERTPGIQDMIITFISLLELARLKKVELFQNEDGKNIYINVIGSLLDFDVDLADGFEDEEPEEAKAEVAAIEKLDGGKGEEVEFRA